MPGQSSDSTSRLTQAPDLANKDFALSQLRACQILQISAQWSGRTDGDLY
jgi:hypothetical protein